MIAKAIVRMFVVIVFFTLMGVLVFFLLPLLLIIPSQTPKAEAIIDLSVDARSQADSYIAWLYRDGVARKIVTVSSQVFHETYPSDFVRDHLISLGVKREDVYSLHLPIVECRVKAISEISKYVKSQGWKSVLIICQPEDSWSIERLGRPIFQRDGAELGVGYAPEDYDAIRTDWYKTHWKVQRFVDEALNSSIDMIYSECR